MELIASCVAGSLALLITAAAEHFLTATLRSWREQRSSQSCS
jgi:hypothetical protein